jgi:hypothetical protein
MWQCSAIITLPCRARIHLFAPLPSQKALAGSSTSRLNINFDLLNAGTANVFYFIDARTRALEATSILPGAALAGALDHNARTQVAGVQMWRGRAAHVAYMSPSLLRGAQSSHLI